MEKICIFCGQRPISKTKEHVIPRWLIGATGDPKRNISFGAYSLTEKEPTPKQFAFDQLTFPACAECNGDFSRLEVSAKSVVEKLLGRTGATSEEFSILLDWLDKVRTGIWLGLTWIEGNPWGIKPKFHISQRVALHDRSVGFSFIEGRHPGINFVGSESPCFGLSPTTMCLFVNDLALSNCSALGLCSRRLGFPFPDGFSLREDGLLEGRIERGLERILKPIETVPNLTPFVYQPVFERGLGGSSDELFETDYVRENALDFKTGRGAVFIQTRGDVSKLALQASIGWMPEGSQSLREVYRTGRRWAYSKLERHYLEQTRRGDQLPGVFRRFHRHLISLFDRHMGL